MLFMTPTSKTTDSMTSSISRDISCEFHFVAKIFDSLKKQFKATKDQLWHAALSVSGGSDETGDSDLNNSVIYSVRLFPSTDLDHRPHEDSDNIFILPSVPCSVKDFLAHLPYPQHSLQVRVLTEDNLRPVWLHFSDPNALLPLDDRNCCRLQVLRLPVPAKQGHSSFPTSTTTVKPSHRHASTAPTYVQPKVTSRHPVSAPVEAESASPHTFKAATETPEQRLRNFQAQVNREEKAREAKSEAQSAIGAELDLWALTEERKLRDVRTLLGTLDKVVWSDSGWGSPSLGELMLSDAAVKKAWRKAIVITHPDRHQGESAERQYRADRIFASINEAYKTYSSS